MTNPAIKARNSPMTPAGQGKGAWLGTLEQGANLLQDVSPLKDFDVYVVGFHCAKGEPGMQMEAHHYCRVANDDMLQCMIFDGTRLVPQARAAPVAGGARPPPTRCRRDGRPLRQHRTHPRRH